MNQNLPATRKLRFYDSLKMRILERVRTILGGRLEKFAELILLIPDITVLLSRLLLDNRLPRRLRVRLGTILAYLASPLDLIPEAVLGPLGLAEDLVLVAFALNRVFAEVDEDILEEHWSGRPEHLGRLRDLSDLVEGIFSGRVGSRLRQWYEEEEPERAETGSGPRIAALNEEEDSAEEKVARLRASGL